MIAENAEGGRCGSSRGELVGVDPHSKGYQPSVSFLRHFFVHARLLSNASPPFHSLPRCGAGERNLGPPANATDHRFSFCDL